MSRCLEAGREFDRPGLFLLEIGPSDREEFRQVDPTPADTLRLACVAARIAPDQGIVHPDLKVTPGATHRAVGAIVVTPVEDTAQRAGLAENQRGVQKRFLSHWFRR